jgi:ribosome recycling factor
MAFNLNNFKDASGKTLEWLKGEYVGLRTGRATPSILDVVSVDSYGSKVPVNNLATISVEGPKSLRISPWDKSVIKNIDVAIRESNLGLSVSVDGEGLRVSFPDLTADRRAGLVKVAKEKLEEARIRVRTERQKTLADIDKSDMGDDEKKRAQNDLQKLVDEANKNLEDLASKKEKEISE